MALTAAPERAAHGSKIGTDEPFHSFHSMDTKMTLLQHQLDALKSASATVQTGPHSIAARKRRQSAAISMNSTAAEIRRTAAGLARLYQARHQPFGVKTFRVLDMRTRDVQRGINAVTKARTRNATNRAVKKLDRSIVSLVVQFQATSGGYGATRCTPGAWTCCDPKRSKDLHESEQVACIWKCVQTPKACTGFLGPHIQ